MARLTKADDKAKISARLARIEGQLRALRAMIDSEADCDKIAQQLAASRKALDKSFFVMVGCLIEQGSPSTKKVTDLLVKLA
jgi:DNA-binding FrmR family transcriptional regulator